MTRSNKYILRLKAMNLLVIISPDYFAQINVKLTRVCVACFYCMNWRLDVFQTVDFFPELIGVFKGVGRLYTLPKF